MKKILKWILIFYLVLTVISLVVTYKEIVIGLALGCLIIFILLKIAQKNGVNIPALPSASKHKISSRHLTEETFHAVGVTYYENNIRKLACDNPDWKLTIPQIQKSGKTGKKIFKHHYVNKPVKLKLEADNPHDKNAIAVIVAGELVGYISRNDNIHVKEILQKHEIKSLSGFIGGGEYKIIDEDGDKLRGEFGFSVNIRIKYI